MMEYRWMGYIHRNNIDNTIFVCILNLWHENTPDVSGQRMLNDGAVVIIHHDVVCDDNDNDEEERKVEMSQLCTMHWRKPKILHFKSIDSPE